MTAAAIASSTEDGVLVAHHRNTARPLKKEVRTSLVERPRGGDKEDFHIAAAIASSTENGVLVAHHRNTARLLKKEVRTVTGGETQSPTLTIPTGEATSCLLIRQQVISVNSRCSQPWK
ncbi:hypothetical protein AVEN_142931-1 [Araneus ventricosus]|uniref:Uncharacterized protein n=1 Tax=Araneus ventricosus TaxID=182803 RepID=A0A4Y2S6G2_ARAVE|nr:hypothetical protein AVEN_142931-1 [Araneus ventricosus]